MTSDKKEQSAEKGILYEPVHEILVSTNVGIFTFTH